MDGLSRGNWRTTFEPQLTQGSINPTDALLRARAGGTLPLGTPGRLILEERTEVIERGAELLRKPPKAKSHWNL